MWDSFVVQTPSIEIRRNVRDANRVEELLRALPGWFEIEEAILDFVEQSHSLPSYAATAKGEFAGIGLVKRHTHYAAEIYLMAVDPRWHRRGIGRALLAAIEKDLVAEGIEYLQVKTLGPSHASPEYELTRRFYEACGFRALEEIEGLWPGNPFLILVKFLPGSSPTVQ
jgi:ribosomal protein S18 acetylase RimI-like enzyme